MLFGNGADEAALHEIVGSRRVPSEGPSVSPQSRDFILQKPGKIAHRHHLWASTSAGEALPIEDQYSGTL
jgi:hypothetical protein